MFTQEYASRSTCFLLIMLIVISSLICPLSADAQQVHALLIILGDDEGIQDAVNANKTHMETLMEKVSKYCEVHMTVMRSGIEAAEANSIGEVKHTTFSNSQRINLTERRQGIVTAQQAVQWIKELQPNETDTILVYYSGHGVTDSRNKHYLNFGVTLTDDPLPRDRLAEILDQKQGRLKLLITDTCNYKVDIKLPPTSFNGVRPGTEFIAEVPTGVYIKDLFLEHSGFLNITAAAAGQYALATTKKDYSGVMHGGYFTYAFVQSVGRSAGVQQDRFLSWEEAFQDVHSGTEALFTLSEFPADLQLELDRIGQTTQNPIQYSLPVRTTDPTSDVTRPSRETITEKNTSKMVRIPAGKFRMGTDQLVGNEAKPIRTVYLDAFYIDTHEVTVGQYKQFLLDSGHPKSLHSELSDFSPTDDHPIVGISWHDAMAYAQWAGKRLPTEAEWEKAARGGLMDKHYPWGNDEIDSTKANYGKIHDHALPVGSYPPNAFGLYDMAGNVAEWCIDPWDGNFYANAPPENPFPGHKSLDETILDYRNVRGSRVIRGGSWAHTKSPSFWVSGRMKYDAMKKPMNIGFRCARTVSP